MSLTSVHALALALALSVQPALAVRPTCHRCARPHRTCICPALPAEPLPLDSRVLVLQHPAESRRSDSTTQLIPLCIDPVDVVRDVKLEAAQLRHYAGGRRPRSTNQAAVCAAHEAGPPLWARERVSARARLLALLVLFLVVAFL